MIHCALCFHNQGEFYKNAYITLLSCIKNSSSPLHVHLVTDDSVKPYFSLFSDLCREHGHDISFYPAPQIPADVMALFRNNAINAYTPASQYRLFLHELIDADKIVYFDCDIVFERDIAELAKVDMGEAYAVGTHDASRKWSPRKKNYYLKKLDISEQRYFNSGVLVLNLARLRQDSADGNLFMEYYRRLAPLSANLDYPIYDQDLLNAMLSRDKEKLLLLDESFNYELCLHQRRFMAMEDLQGKILHYAALKPWEKFFPAHLPYWNYFAQSPWAAETFPSINRRLHDPKDPWMSVAMSFWKKAKHFRWLSKLLG